MQNVLITGVSSGIGYVTTRYLASKGFRVIGSVRKSTDAKALQEDLGDLFIPLIFDVCDTEAIAQSVLELEDILGGEGLIGLVNNAGLAVNGPLEHIPIEEFAYQLEVNVTSVVRVTQAFLPLLGTNKKKYTHSGRIINIGSISGVMTRPFFGPYSASKFALEAVTDAMRRELEPAHGIRVSLIQAGPAKTPIWAKAKAEGNRYAHTIYNDVLKNRNRLIEKAESVALDTIEISKVIHKALSSPHPKPRYMPTNHKILVKLMAYVFPDRLNDRLYTKYMNKYFKDSSS